MRLRDVPMPALVDREVKSVKEDKFGHDHFASALRGLIESEANVPPFSIGLLGGWGTGKSTIKSLYLSKLQDDASKDNGGGRRADCIKPITFNAWRYGGRDTDIKRALLRHVYRELDGDELRLVDKLSNQVTHSILEPRKWGDILRELYESTLWNLLPIAVVALLYVVAVGLLVRWLPVGWVSTLAATLTPGTLLALASKYFGDPRRFVIRRIATATRVELPRTTTEEYEDLLVEQLCAFKKGRGGSRYKRLVIFIDDLDRLSAEEMVSSLDAIRTFMEMPGSKLPAGLGIVFVISCDENRVAAALASRHAQQTSSDVPGAIRNLADARRFLDRIFQFRLEIPPFPKQDMRQFVEAQLDEKVPQLKADLEERHVSIPTLVDRMIHVGVDNPRKALQILNAFAQSWWLASIREYQGAGSDLPGALREGSVSAHPISLAALCALRVECPDFYAHLQQDPTLIERFTAVFIHGQDLGQQPESARHILREYALLPAPNQQETDLQVKPLYRPLRQLLASLQGLQWPQSLEPLLLLTQDPVSRQYPDGARQLYDALLSADTLGVLEELGLHLDGRLLTHRHVQLIRDLLENSSRESSERQDNAAYVVADLADRIPPQHASFLIGPLCARLEMSSRLRSRIGVDRIAKAIENAHPDHQRHLSGCLIKDLLLPNGETSFKKPTGQTPALSEAVGMARSACSTILKVRDRVGLAQNEDQQLVKWLRIRQVQVDGHEEVLPFAELEGWIAQHEPSLLIALRQYYTELLIGELENDRLRGIDPVLALQRAEKVFGSLWDAGSEDRIVLWQQLTRLVGVRLDDAVAVANKVADQHLDDADANAVSAFVSALENRLQKEMEDDQAWPLDWENGAHFAVEFVVRRKTDLSQTAWESTATLAGSYLKVRETADYGVQLLSTLQEVTPEQGEKVVQPVISSLLEEYPEPTVRWFAQQGAFALSADALVALRQYLDAKIGKRVPSDEVAKHYAWFIDGLSDQSLQQAQIRSHLLQAFSFLQQQHGNLAYIKLMLPILAPLLRRDIHPEIGHHLQALVTNSQANLDLLGQVHELMTEYWPSPAANLQGYNPDQLFSHAVQLARQHPGNPRAGAILRSVTLMVTDGVVNTEGASENVAELACHLWPHQKSVALAALEGIDTVPDPVKVAQLLDSSDLSNEQDFETLQKVWCAIAKRQTQDGHLATTRLVGSKQRKAGPQESKMPDAGLSIWLDALEDVEEKRVVLRTILLDSSLPDQQRQRFWAQIIRYSQELGCRFLVDLLPAMFALRNAEHLQRDILNDRDRLTSVCKADGDRQSLAETILACLVCAPSLETKALLAQWLSGARGEGPLRAIEGMNTTLEDLQTLQTVFPSNRYIKKRLAKLAKPDTN